MHLGLTAEPTAYSYLKEVSRSAAISGRKEYIMYSFKFFEELYKPVKEKDEMLKLLKEGKIIELEKDGLYIRIKDKKKKFIISYKIVDPLYWGDWHKKYKLNIKKTERFLLYLINEGWNVYTA